MPLRFIAINGSERPHGSTHTALVRAAEHLRRDDAELEIINLAECDIRPCPCGRCNSRPDPCPIDDDVAGIVDRMTAAEAIIYAAPVHGFGLASAMQHFIERAGVGYLRFNRPLTNRVGGIIIVGRRYSHANVHAQLTSNMMLNRMIMVGSGFPALLQGGGPLDIADDVEGLDAMYRMLDRMTLMCRTLRTTELATPAGVELRAGRLS